MDCIITIKGSGRGTSRGHGVPVHDRTEPVRNFLVDNTHFYIAITEHLTTCKVCSIDQILKEYLRRRIEIPKFHGATGSSLIKRSIILERLAMKKGEILTPGLVNQFVIRGCAEDFARHSERLDICEQYFAIKLMSRRTHQWREQLESSMKSQRTKIKAGEGIAFMKMESHMRCIKEIADLVSQGVNAELSQEELEKLLRVSSVMNS